MKSLIEAGFCRVLVVENERGVCSIRLVNSESVRDCSTASNSLSKKIELYLRGKRADFSNVKLDFSGSTKFQKRVWDAARKIPYGETRTYGWLAKKVGSSPRAVGQALKKNPVAVLIPCHRVVSSNGVGGFSFGVALKRRLLKLEGAL